MANNVIKFTGDYQLFMRFISAGTWNTVFARAIRRATIKNCLYLVKAIKQEIRQKKYTANAQLTLALKKGSIPLLDEKNLFDAITYQLENSFYAEVGVFSGRESSGGVKSSPIDMQHLTELLHTGYVIRVTPKMRAAIMAALMEKRNAKQRLTRKAKSALRSMASRTGSGAQTYRVPPRKFLTDVWERQDIQNMIRQNWRDALEQALLEAGAKDGENKDK